MKKLEEWEKISAALDKVQADVIEASEIARAMVHIVTSHNLNFVPQDGPTFGNEGYAEAWQPPGVGTTYKVRLGLQDWELQIVGPLGGHHPRTYHNTQIDANVAALKDAATRLARIRRAR